MLLEGRHDIHPFGVVNVEMTQKLLSQAQQSRIGNALCQRTFILRLAVTSGPDVDHSLFDATLPAGAYRGRITLFE